MTEKGASRRSAPSAREKWQAEIAIREREVAVLEREQATRESELELERNKAKRSGWLNPLVIAVIAAAVAAGGNAYIADLNGKQQRALEEEKAEQTRILEMIKTGDPDKAAENLQFLLDAGLIVSDDIKVRLTEYLEKRKPGTGPALAATGSPFSPGIVGRDDAVPVHQLPENSPIRKLASAVGRFYAKGENSGFQPKCTAFLVAEDLAITSGFCVKDATAAKIEFDNGAGELPERYDVVLPAVEQKSHMRGFNYALLKLKDNPGAKHGIIPFKAITPRVGQSLAIVYFRTGREKLAVAGTPDCEIKEVEPNVLHHICDTGGGSSGAPVISARDHGVIGVHFGRGRHGGVAVRLDAIIRESKTLHPR